MLSVAVIVSCMAVLCVGQRTGGAGRAFPIDSENYIQERFSSVNPRIEWDHTNFLVDLAGHYANCRQIGSGGQINIDQRMPNGDSVVGVTDSADGTRTDIDAVNGYIRSIVDRWMFDRTYNYQIRNARAFGCSVRPGCSGRAVVACLFTPGSSGDHQNEQPEDIEAQQNAQAFTGHQYRVAERITGNRWDRSHMLENLSGFETSCSMIGTNDWPFTKANQVADTYGLRVTAVYGVAPNTGSTDQALMAILNNFKQIQDARRLGCSVIPDCVRENQMFVVVSCIYQIEIE